MFGRYRPPVAHDGPAVRTGPQAPAPARAERERERDDQGDATVVFGRYRPPVAHDEPTVIAASRPRPWSDDDEATIVMAPVPAVIGAAPTPAGPVGQVTQRTASRRAPDASSAQPTRPIAAAEALPATIAATGERRNRHRGLTFLMLLAALVALSIGSILRALARVVNPLAQVWWRSRRYSGRRPALRPTATASMALWQPSFTITLRICVRTVFGDWCSFAAMPLRSRPLTIRLST